MPGSNSWKLAWPVAVWVGLLAVPVPGGLQPHQWHYFAVFAAAIVAMVVTPLPGGAIALIAVSFIAAMGYVEADATASVRWALSGFADPAVWLTFGAFLFALGYRSSGLGRRIALSLVRRLGRRTLGLGQSRDLHPLGEDKAERRDEYDRTVMQGPMNDRGEKSHVTPPHRRCFSERRS